MRTFTVKEPVFKTEPLFIVGCSFPALSIYMKRCYRVDVGEDVGQLGQMFTFQKSPHRVVWAAKPDLGVVLHEVFHLVTRICYDRDISIRAHTKDGEIGDEPAAFMFEFFARAVLRRLQ